MKTDPATRRYTLGLLLVMSSYVLILIGVNAYFENRSPTGLVALVAASLPALPIIAVFALIGRLLVELKDEYVRMLTVRQSLIATAFALSICTVWGFMESFDLVAHVDAYWASVLWFMGLGVGGCTNAFIEWRAAR